MKSIAQEFALEVQERKDRGLVWTWGRFESDGPIGFDYELWKGYDDGTGESEWTVSIESIQVFNEDGDVCGWYDKKQLAEFIAEANEQLMGCIL